MNIKSCGSRSFRKHIDIKNSEQYIVLDISPKHDFLDNREVESSESRGYIGRPVKVLTSSLDIRTKSQKKQKKVKFLLADITNQYLKKFLKKFNNLPCLEYNSKQVHNEPTKY